MKIQHAVIILLTIWSCNTNSKTNTVSDATPLKQQHLNEEMYKLPQLHLEQANGLVELPLSCVDVEYPNRLNQTLAGNTDLLPPKVLHPTFYGCFDWHSAVHAHWSMVSLLRQFPNLKRKAAIETWLLQSITKANIAKEVAYFNGKHNATFERTYGWAWLLKLDEELHKWNTETAKTLQKNLQPLTDLIVDKYMAFLPKLNYPIRVGEHPNTAFGLSFAFDYAETVNNLQLKKVIVNRAKHFYSTDVNCPISWEPGGYDFLSPCLEEAALMKRVLPKPEFITWVTAFLPQLTSKNFELAVGEVSDRTDGKLVHLDGVNFSRAWSLNVISKDIEAFSHLKPIAVKHLNYSLPNIIGDSYEGGHWLGSFAIYAFQSFK